MTENFLRFTIDSLSASYIPFPRFLMEDSLAGISNDAEQAQKKLHRSRQCATRIFRELESCGLICRKKQGLGKPALITLNYPSSAKLIQPKETGEILSG